MIIHYAQKLPRPSHRRNTRIAGGRRDPRSAKMNYRFVSAFATFYRIIHRNTF